MIRAAVALLRTSLVSVLFLAAALMTLASVLSEGPPPPVDGSSELAGALTAVTKPNAPSGETPAALRIALFDPERRAETVAGSIDDLRGLAAPPAEVANIAIVGVLLSGKTRKAMLGPVGGAMAWTGIGDDVGGWHVSGIDAAGAVLEHDGRTLSLKVADRLKARAHAGDTAAATSPPASPDAPPPDPFAAPDPAGPPKP